MIDSADVREGAVFVTSNHLAMFPMRRVIAVVNGVVCYSTGGDTNRLCQVRTFVRWCRRSPARRAND